MATIFKVYDGVQQGSWGELPWPRCAEAFRLDDACWTEKPPPSPGVVEKHPGFPDHIVIHVEQLEAGQHGIKPGYFLSPQSGLEAKFALDRVKGRDS